MLDQIAIGILGVTSLACSQNTDKRVQKWSCILGLLAQPFWFYTTYMAAQWGIFALCVVYSLVWWYGFYNFWIAKDSND